MIGRLLGQVELSTFVLIDRGDFSVSLSQTPKQKMAPTPRSGRNDQLSVQSTKASSINLKLEWRIERVAWPLSVSEL